MWSRCSLRELSPVYTRHVHKPAAKQLFCHSLNELFEYLKKASISRSNTSSAVEMHKQYLKQAW